MSWIAISEACKTRIQPLIKSSDLQDSDENPEEVMTRNLYAGFRNKGLQDTVSYSDEIMPTIWNYIFFQFPMSVNNFSFPDTYPAQPFECSSLCFFISHDSWFSGFLSPFSVHLLTLFLLP